MGRSEGFYKEREPHTVEEAVVQAIAALGVEPAANAAGCKPQMLRRYSDPAEHQARLPAVCAANLDRALLHAQDPRDRRPVLLLAHAHQIGVELTWRPRVAAPTNRSVTDLALDVVAQVGVLAGAAGRAGVLTEADALALARVRDQLTATLNTLVAVAEAQGAVHAPRLRLIVGGEG